VGGENPKEFEVCGVPHGERGARVTEAIDVVRALWRDTPASFHRRFTHFE
jgi:alkanesulfonate monooxygenase SsuD/methylene tetrahydromethanopterin reductase-like flavin-dependent oxidoreductase (luciferase family)